MDKEQIIASLARIEFWREIAAAIVAIALGAEVILGFRYAARNKELGVLQKKEEQQLTLQIEGLRSNNLVLQKQLFDLRLAQEPRIFTQQERESFIKLLQNRPKGSVRMGVLQSFDQKTKQLANQIYDLLVGTGYIIPQKIEMFGNFNPTNSQPEGKRLVKCPDQMARKLTAE
jgi:hypothetical protein